MIKSCARGDTICPRPLQVDNIFVFIRQVALIPAYWPFNTSATSWPLTFDLETGDRVTCDAGYLCANFTLPRHKLLCSRLRPDVCDRRQTSDRQTSDRTGGIIILVTVFTAAFGLPQLHKLLVPRTSTLRGTHFLGSFFATQPSPSTSSDNPSEPVCLTVFNCV